MHGQQRDQPTAEGVGGHDAERADPSNGSRSLAAWDRHHRLMREVNERIRELAERNGIGVRLLCECGDLSCVDALEMSEAEYARFRVDESQFLVFPGHERPESERIVERTGRFVVVANRELENGPQHGRESRGDG